MSESHLKLNIDDILHKIVIQEGIQSVTISSKDESSKGDGYVGTVNTFELIGSNKTLSVIIKYASNNINFRKSLPIRESFLSEIKFYDKIVPYFQELLKEAAATFNGIPRCYSTCNDELQELLVLENLKKEGYVLSDRLKPRDQKEVELVLKTYGKFHALSFTLKEREPVKYAELAESLGDNMKRWFIQGRMINTCVELSKQFRSRIMDKVQLERFIKVFDDMKSFLMDYDYSKDQYSVIAHGDCWSSNMMMKYEVINGCKEPKHLKLIDFQLCRSSSIIFDLSLFLCICTDYKIWNNLDHYLQIYYTTLSSFMKELGGDISKTLSFDSFKEEFKKKCKFGMLLTILYMKSILFETDEVPDFKHVTEETEYLDGFLQIIKHQEIYNERYQFLVDYFYKNEFY